jgi:hypothetical protein
MMGQSETVSNNSQIIFITLFSIGAEGCFASYQPPPAVQLYSAKTIFLSQTHIVGLFSSNFTMQDHILSIAGDALTPYILTIYMHLLPSSYLLHYIQERLVTMLIPDINSAVGVHPTQLWFIHNSVMMGFQWMVCWCLLVHSAY